MPFTVIRWDITKIKVDAIVNAANPDLQRGGGVCGAIFRAAGAARLQAFCDELAPIKVGEAVITPGFGLPAKYIIHTAGPIYGQGRKKQNERHLRAAYTNSLKKAMENACESIAFPLISSGIYGYPKDEALQASISAIDDFLTDHDIDVTLVLYDEAAFSVNRELSGTAGSNIDERCIDTHKIKRRQPLDAERGNNASVFEEMRSPDAEAPVPRRRKV